MKYIVDCTVTYNGCVEIEADNGMEAIEKAQEYLNVVNLDKFPDSVDIGNIIFNWGEAIAEYATEVDF